MKNLLIATFFLWAFLLQAQDFDPSKEQAAPEILTKNKGGQMLPKQPNEEWRAFWVDAWNKGIFTPKQVAETVQIAHSYGYNAIVIQVRRRGDAIYLPKYPNIEPRMPGLEANFDVLQEFIKQAHKYKIEVHAWITTFLVATATPPSSKKHIFHLHPEYLTQSYQGEKKIGEGHYLDPGHPKSLEWNTRVVMDLVKNYDIDGLHFDYIRYPGQNSGYNAMAIARYNKEFNLKGKPKPEDPRFGQWRRRQITDWLSRMYFAIVAQKPRLKVTAATFASRNDAYYNRFQDWALWMEKGILDANVAMNYSSKDSIYQKRVDDIIAHSYGRHVYMGVGAYLLDIDHTIEQLQYARKANVHGLILFSYAYNTKKGKSLSGFKKIYDHLFYAPAQVPKMPWKDN